MELGKFVYTGEGLKRGYENQEWTVGIKNYKQTNDIAFMNNLERHNGTDELFVLVEGKCSIVTAEKVNGELIFHSESMDKGVIYTIPKGLWHNTVTAKSVKLVLIENSNTSMENSDILKLNEDQINKLKKSVLK